MHFKEDQTEAFTGISRQIHPTNYYFVRRFSTIFENLLDCYTMKQTVGTGEDCRSSVTRFISSLPVIRPVHSGPSLDCDTHRVSLLCFSANTAKSKESSVPTYSFQLGQPSCCAIYLTWFIRSHRSEGTPTGSEIDLAKRPVSRGRIQNNGVNEWMSSPVLSLSRIKRSLNRSLCQGFNNPQNHLPVVTDMSRPGSHRLEKLKYV